MNRENPRLWKTRETITDFEEPEHIEDPEDIYERCGDYIADAFDISEGMSSSVMYAFSLRLRNLNIDDYDLCDKIIRFLEVNEDLMDIIHKLDDRDYSNQTERANLVRQMGQIIRQRPI